MEFFDGFFGHSFNDGIDEENIKSKIRVCKEYVDEGQTFAFLENIEETIQLCMEVDYSEDGIYLTDAVLDIAPYNSDFWQYKGIFLNNLMDFESAYESFNKSLSLNPSDVETLINKSVSEENLGMVKEALESLEKAFTIDPSNDEVLFNLALLNERKKDFESASYYLEKAIELDDQYSEAWYELGFCYENSDQLENALHAYDNFLALEPFSATGWYNRGIVLIRL